MNPICLIVLSTIQFVCVYGMTKESAMEYLSHYGYMVRGNESDFHGCLKTYQKYASIPTTGQMDAMTDKMMTTPRCGCSDKRMLRKKRFTIQGSLWRLRNLTYHVEPPEHLIDLVHAGLEDAFKEWSKYAGIHFHKSEAHKALINVTFAKMPREEILGMAEYPIFGGHITFNEDIDWKEKDVFANVALHEIGHTLGLDHSNKTSSVMYPFYNTNDSNDCKICKKSKYVLTKDDIDGINLLYDNNRQ